MRSAADCFIDAHALRFTPDSDTNLLQVVRFDFMLDAARKVWLIEINQSPRIHVNRQAGDTAREAWRTALADDIAASRAESRAGQACELDHVHRLNAK